MCAFLQECPTCRKKLVSKRSLRPDPNFDLLISKIYPSRDEYEAHQERVLAKLNNSHSQAALVNSITEGIKLQSQNRPQRSRKTLNDNEIVNSVPSDSTQDLHVLNPHQHTYQDYLHGGNNSPPAMDGTSQHSGDNMDQDMEVTPTAPGNNNVTADGEANGPNNHAHNAKESPIHSSSLRIPATTRYPHSANLDKLFKQARREGLVRLSSAIAPNISTKKRSYDQASPTKDTATNSGTEWQFPKRAARPPPFSKISEASFIRPNKFSAMEDPRARAHASDFRRSTSTRAPLTQASAPTFEYEWPSLPSQCDQFDKQPTSQRARPPISSQQSEGMKKKSQDLINQKRDAKTAQIANRTHRPSAHAPPRTNPWNSNNNNANHLFPSGPDKGSSTLNEILDAVKEQISISIQLHLENVYKAISANTYRIDQILGNVTYVHE
ncbi:hypothetical protein QAD02_003251 [Eretmocerus hayati]|uniref:Uncharacterized protein n=1 Tax=Eretmocerus hayati TaxID=131215 RepID=A0ACC2NLN2_9HYME|nr:hypothetical protein QAD02_003251 [Eretmocerus hayati]